MIYVDTDFVLALLKESDWLKSKAQKLYDKYKDELFTSGITIVEVLLLAKRFDIDPEVLLVSLFQIIPTIKGLEKNTALLAAHYMKEGVNVFDALHASSCGSCDIISSDSVYDKIGLRRIDLRE